jgi:signal transduction histidine kinase
MVRTGDRILSVVRDITARKRAEQETQELSGRLITAQEDERARIARELHDDACQNLALLAIEIEMFGQQSMDDKGSVDAGRKELSARVSAISADLRRLSHKLHPAILTKLGLVTALRGFCGEIESAHDLEVEFVEKDVPSTLSDATSLCVYRVVQESLQNVVKHSGATAVSVNLSANGNGLRLAISDNGSGFDPEAALPEGSLGLISMRERIRLVNGSISIDSTGEKGTRIEATIPV